MTTPVIHRRWTTVEASALTGATYRQLDYWLRHGWLGSDNAHGSGSQRTLTRTQLRRAQILAITSAAGVNPRHVAPRLPDIDAIPADATVVHLSAIGAVSLTIRIKPIP